MVRSIKAIRREMDRVWSLIIRSTGRCAFCGKTSSLNAHHIFGRRNLSTRWDISNGVCLCAGCHTFSSTFSAHQTPMFFDDWIKDLRGERWYSKLCIEAHMTVKYTRTDYLKMLVSLKERYDEVK